MPGAECVRHDGGRARGVRSGSAGSPEARRCPVGATRCGAEARRRRTLAAHAGGDARLSQRSERTAAVLTPEGWYNRATSSGATRTAATGSSGAPTTCSSPAARTFFRARSSWCWRATPMSRRLASCRCRTRSRAPSRWPSSRRGQAAIRTRKRSSASCSPTRPRTSIREGCSSCSSCRSRAPTRSIAGLWNKRQ